MRIIVSLDIWASCNIRPINNMSSRYTIIRKFIRRNTATGIFINLVKSFGAGPRPKQRQRNSYSLPQQGNRTNVVDEGFKGIEEYASFRSSLHMQSHFFKTFFRQCNLSIFKCSDGISSFRFFKFIFGRFTPSFLYT